MSPGLSDPSDTYKRSPLSGLRDAAQTRALRNAQKIASLLPSDRTEFTLGLNGTFYLEWESGEGFASLEVGTDRFGFAFIPTVGEPYGENGQIADTARLRRLIETHV